MSVLKYPRAILGLGLVGALFVTTFASTALVYKQLTFALSDGVMVP